MAWAAREKLGGHARGPAPRVLAVAGAAPAAEIGTHRSDGAAGATDAALEEFLDDVCVVRRP